MSAQYTDPALTSPTAKADAFTKLASAIPGFSETEVGLEMAGLTREQIIRFQAEKRTSSISSLVEQIAARGDQGGIEDAAPENTEAEDAATMKAKFDALGVAIRAGVVPADAARRLGLDGVQFTGLQPVSLRDPNEKAAVAPVAASDDE